MLTSLLTDEGVRLSVRESGPAHGPAVVLVHGWAQSGEVWPPAESFHAYAPDLRGHGESDVLADGYRDSATWAGDLRTVLDHTGPAVLVGWSYGGLVLTDYLRHHGTAAVRGLVLVGAITGIGPDRPGGATGRVMREALPDALSDDPEVAVPALLRFCAAQTPGAVPGVDVQRMLGTALRVPARVRRELFRRDVDGSEVLKAVDRPTLVVHGTADEVVHPAAAEHAAATVPGAEMRWYEAVGHLPFRERPERFAADLAAFVAEVGP
ncbi:alpha/beta hydrolase [Actinosynnema sp. NPDC047251]|uniref:Alpha/beta hydrolase fold containing protein n=1 Tax=Saccharothrix espanaensis (strain ATCC 51144 / DSM 44229 / JCM 9112 / NBRC 15066 / NRRL 15764) TaxID=1179773 RepID=K0KAL1_SACES|nr:alpha/beta hydrolase [Saccharothrix espanaensis]CCH35336.1 alpha/beta hydrolase fold containing protein [Saccharothrix espanaensis DSM 44229]